MGSAASPHRQEVTPHEEAKTRPILIFPGGMPRSLEFMERCEREGQPVVGASSLPDDPAKGKYSAWAFLPYVTDPEFGDTLMRLIEELDVGGVFSPNIVAWNYIDGLLRAGASRVRLVNSSPLETELSGFRSARQRARELLAGPLAMGSTVAVRPPMSEIELASLFRHADVIPGMCDHEKMASLYEVARRSVPGDIVEIGSWWGKSAFILTRLARYYGIGKLLCVDPWSDEHLVQNDEGGLVDNMSSQATAEEALRVFEMNLLPYSAGNVNYLRMPSVEGARHYRDREQVVTDTFGRTDYEGRIALLHIDGNHSYPAVKDDILAWCGLVGAGGWIIIDDYVWPYGDGPRQAGDEFLAEHGDRIGHHFLAGSALFVQLTSPIE